MCKQYSACSVVITSSSGGQAGTFSINPRVFFPLRQFGSILPVMFQGRAGLIDACTDSQITVKNPCVFSVTLKGKNTSCQF